MTCASCGQRVAPGARYCVHCGAEQSVPTPIAVAASIARRGGREAANAANAESTATVASIGFPNRAPPERVRERRDANAEPHAANSDQPGRPAYADGPSRRGLAITVVASLAVVVVALGAYAAWRIEGTHGDVVATTSVDPVAATLPPAPTAPTAEGANTASGSATPAAQASTAPTDAPVASQGAQATGNAAGPASDATVPVEIRPLPPHPATSRTHAAQANKPAAPMTTTKAAEPPGAQSQADTTAPAVTHAHVAATSTLAAAHSADRWQRLDEEIAQCTRADFITRVICGQRARFRYCNGYWGKVPQCPGSPSTADRGQ